MEIQRPAYMERLIAKKGNGLVKVVTGVRRCGKSYLLLKMLREHLAGSGVAPGNVIELAFDRFSSAPLRDPNEFYSWVTARLGEAGPGERYVLLDEVQLLERFEEVLIDLMAMPGVDVYVTGSNARLLSRDIATEFRGRGDEIELRPLSFSEYAAARGVDPQRAYEEYSVYGGMPATLSMPDPGEKAAYLENLFGEIYVNDLIERNGIRSVGDLEAVIDVLSSGMGSLTNPKRISDTFRSAGSGKGPGPDTVRAYVEHLKDAFIIEEAKRYDVKGRKYIGSPFKYYFCDLGLRNARRNFRQVEPTHAMENVVYNELRARGLGVDIGVVTRYLRDDGGKQTRQHTEIDFVCNKGDKRCYIQSAYAMPDEAKRKQEEAPLASVDDSFRKVVVVRDPVVPRYDDTGVLVMGVIDFLLDPDSLGM